MRQLWIGLLVIASLAGCTDDGDEAPAPIMDPEPMISSETGTASFSWSFGVTTPANGVILTPAETEAANPFREADVNATVTWSCLNVICPMQVALRVGDSNIAEAAGDSPLTLSAEDVRGSVSMYMWPADPVSVGVDAQGTADITFTRIVEPESDDGERTT